MRENPVRGAVVEIAAAVIVWIIVGPVCAAGSPGVRPTVHRLTDEQLEQLSDATVTPSPATFTKHPKIATALLEVIRSRLVGADWRAVALSHSLLVRGDNVLVEIRSDARWGRAVADRATSLGGRIRHQVVPSLIEVWLPPGAIERVAEDLGVRRIAPARQVRLDAGSVVSEGVAALNVSIGAVSYDYHDLGADGSGVTVANIDGGYANYDTLQSSGDWPQPAYLRRFEVSGGPVVDCDLSACSGYEGSNHGAATMEIVFDVAPGADYLTYATTTIGDWYTALVDAADRGAAVITESLSAPLDGIGDGSECPPIWTAPCGTIAEAAGYARSQGALVVNSAANYGTEHWGGTFVDRGDGTLDWGSGGNLNVGDYCYPNGYLMSIDLFWDDWSDPVDHDYDLRLYELRASGWTLRATSEDAQNGGAGQTPQEHIRYLVSGASGSGGVCSGGSAVFGILVLNYSAATDRNLQVFANDWGSLAHVTEDRSLGFPADSPNVFAVGAVDVSNPGTLEDYSSEGPVLGPGGSQAAPDPPNPKPDAVSVARVSTVAYGAGGFAGTSASAPHAAGVAAILTQLRNEKFETPPVSNNPDGMADQLALFALEDPSFPSTFDTTYGNGLVRLRFCDETINVGAAEFVMVGLPCNQRGSQTVGDLLGGILGGDYGIWTWDADSEQYHAIHDDPDPASVEMQPGVGYWVWYENPFSVTMQGLPRDRTEPYRMSLVGESPGLGRPNFIGHPYDFDVAWPEVVIYAGGSEYDLAGAESAGILRNIMWKPYTVTGYTEWDGTAAPAEGTFNTFDGFWVKAWQDCELGIPVTTSTAPVSDALGRSAGAPGWTIQLGATMDGVTAKARIGQLPDADFGWDRRDAELMPSAETHQFYVVIPHDDWGAKSAAYVRDYHPRRRSDEWRFEVRDNLGRTVVLHWTGPAHLLRRSVLFDLETGRKISVADLAGGYKFAMTPGRREFVWSVR